MTRPCLGTSHSVPPRCSTVCRLNGTAQAACERQLCSPEAQSLRAQLDQLVLSNDAVWAREKLRPPVNAPLVLLGPYYVLCWALDAFFEDRPIARFWFLETVARM